MSFADASSKVVEIDVEYHSKPAVNLKRPNVRPKAPAPEADGVNPIIPDAGLPGSKVENSLDLGKAVKALQMSCSVRDESSVSEDLVSSPPPQLPEVGPANAGSVECSYAGASQLSVQLGGPLTEGGTTGNGGPDSKQLESCDEEPPRADCPNFQSFINESDAGPLPWQLALPDLQSVPVAGVPGDSSSKQVAEDRTAAQKLLLLQHHAKTEAHSRQSEQSQEAIRWQWPKRKAEAVGAAQPEEGHRRAGRELRQQWAVAGAILKSCLARTCHFLEIVVRWLSAPSAEIDVILGSLLTAEPSDPPSSSPSLMRSDCSVEGHSLTIPGLGEFTAAFAVLIVVLCTAVDAESNWWIAADFCDDLLWANALLSEAANAGGLSGLFGVLLCT
ncbi:hypothetical protein Nepgr_025371 [Nepenthes gracilis]|uniref:Uncharacterized protein n=1 Tax=Nepenthes gracilis TaxID=150966 RepID=A0AAD3T653_NEPGR|nr:hypothetical protein Nepgr_025371 [Nepenthes gracilis]